MKGKMISSAQKTHKGQMQSKSRPDWWHEIKYVRNLHRTNTQRIYMSRCWYLSMWQLYYCKATGYHLCEIFSEHAMFTDLYRGNSWEVGVSFFMLISVQRDVMICGGVKDQTRRIFLWKTHTQSVLLIWHDQTGNSKFTNFILRTRPNTSLHEGKVFLRNRACSPWCWI